MRQLLQRIDEGEQGDLHTLVGANVASYDNYNRTFLEDWLIRDTGFVVPTETVEGYAAHERRVCLEEEPIYGLVAYLPCFYLWPWFARQLKASPLYRPGVYQSWFDGVYRGEDSFGGAWAIGNFIEDWIDSGRPFDRDLAHDIYRTSMEFELKVFAEAYTD